MNKLVKKQEQRLKRKKHVRKNILGTALVPRLTVTRSSRYIYAQIINDEESLTLASASDVKSEKKGKKTESAMEIGKELAKRAKLKKIDKVVFDRNGYKYHGRVKALADGAREGGLKF